MWQQASHGSRVVMVPRIKATLQQSRTLIVLLKEYLKITEE